MEINKEESHISLLTHSIFRFRLLLFFDKAGELLLTAFIIKNTQIEKEKLE